MINDKCFAFVPSYNHAGFIERCLRSIFRQTTKPAKLLVIDDGSRDNSPRVIERVLRDCPFPCEFVARENRGLCRTLNEGFASSFGDYFAYLGSDDVWLPDFLANRISLLDSNKNAAMAYGNAYLIDEQDCILENSADWAAYKYDDTRKMLLMGIAPVSSSVCYRRTALEKVRWNDDSRLEDYELYLKLSAVGEFVFDKEVRAAWRQHGYNTSADLPLMLREVIAAQNRNRAVFGVDDSELALRQREIKFLYAEILARRGRRKEALNLALESWRGAYSTAAIGKMAARLLIPQSVVKWRKQRENKRSLEKYGVLQQIETTRTGD